MVEYTSNIAVVICRFNIHQTDIMQCPFYNAQACGVGTPIICMPEDRTDLVGEILGPCVNDSKESECGRSDYPASMENHSPTHVDESKMDDQWDRLRSVETSNVSGKRKGMTVLNSILYVRSFLPIISV